MAIYTKKVIGFSDAEILVFLVISSSFAIAGSFISGFITDRIGPKKTLTIILTLWCIAIALAALSLSRFSFWVVGPLVGIALGSTWVAGRTMVIALAPECKIGEIFGL